MHIHELMKKFSNHKNYATEDVNELLDFAKKAYIFNEITSSDYKKIVRELELQGAKLPQESNENELIIEN